MIRRKERHRGQRDCSLSPRDRSASPRERSLSHRDRSPSPRDRSPSPMDRSPSPKDRSPSLRDRSPSPWGSPCAFRRRHQDTAQEDDQLHSARVAANRPLAASSSPEPDSPTYLSSDFPPQKRPHGPDSRFLNFCQPANISPDAARPAASRSAASRLSPTHLAAGGLQQGSPVHGTQQSSRNVADGSKAEQVEIQLHSPIAKRKLDVSSTDKTGEETGPMNSGNTDSSSTAALGQIYLTDPPTFADLHARVSDASYMPITHVQDRADAAATKRHRQAQGGKSLLKKVLRKSLAKQTSDCKGLSGSDASCNSSQDVIHACSESASDAQTLPAKAPDASQRPQQAEHGERADVKRSRRAKRPRPADSQADPSKQADAQTRLQDDRAKHKNKRRHRSSGECICHRVWPCISCSLAFVYLLPKCRRCS